MKNTLCTILFYFFIMSFTLSANDLAKGQVLFKARCAACHGISKELTGPALAGIADRHSEAWLLAFVRNSQKMIAEGDKMAIQIFEMYNSLPMPAQQDLCDEDIRDIVAFIGEATKQVSASEKQQNYVADATNSNKKFLTLNEPATFIKVGLTTLFVPLLLFSCFLYRKAGRVSK